MSSRRIPPPSTNKKGARPVLIISPAAFNRVTKTPVALSITSGGGFARTRGFAVSLDATATRTKGVIRCDQPRAIDIGARGGRKIETVPTILG